jgi:glutamine cyclotransferase
VSDYISGLRTDLVEAADRERRRGAVARTTRPLHPRAWNPGIATGATAIAAAAAAFVLVVLALAPRRADRAASPEVVATIRVAGTPTAAAYGDGCLWITDFAGRLVRVDPATGRVVGRYALGAQPTAVAAAPDAIWVRTAAEGPNGGTGSVLRVDPASGRVVARAKVGDGEGIAVAGDSVWVPRRFNNDERIDRIDRARTAVTGRVDVRNVAGIAGARGALWAGVQEGTIVQIDPRDGRVLERWPALAPSAGDLARTLAPDAGGLWVLSTARNLILRIENGRVVRRIAVAPGVRPILARTRGGLWAATGGGSTAGPAADGVERIDPATGRVVERIDLHGEPALALVPAGRDLAVVTEGGRVIVVRG